MSAVLAILVSGHLRTDGNPNATRMIGDTGHGSLPAISQLAGKGGMIAGSILLKSLTSSPWLEARGFLLQPADLSKPIA
ncbi:MAG: hypothetical protein ACKO24_11080 [Leptolyngbyaceae cyanobacterium]